MAAVIDRAPQSEAVAEPESATAAATFDDGSETMCVQAANLADWNPFLPCTPTKAYKIVVKPKIIIGAEPPKPAETQRSKPVEVAEATMAPAPKVAEPKAEKQKPAAKLDVVMPAPEPEPAEEAAEADGGGSCTQGATLADWNPDLPCASDGNSSTLRIEVKE